MKTGNEKGKPIPLPKICDLVISGDAIPLQSHISTEVGEQFVVSELIVLIARAAVFLGVKRVPDEPTIAKIVNYILRDYSDLTFEDFVLFFEQIETGRYGNLYENFSGAKILEFLKIYVEGTEECEEYLDGEKNKVSHYKMVGGREQELHAARKRQFENNLPEATKEQKEMAANYARKILDNLRAERIEKPKQPLTPYGEYIEIRGKHDSLTAELDEVTEKGTAPASYIQSLNTRIDEYSNLINRLELAHPYFKQQYSDMLLISNQKPTYDTQQK